MIHICKQMNERGSNIAAVHSWKKTVAIVERRNNITNI